MSIKSIGHVGFTVSDMEKASVLTKMSKEYRNKMKIFKSQLEETDTVLRYIRIPYNYLRVKESLIMEKKPDDSGISAIAG